MGMGDTSNFYEPVKKPTQVIVEADTFNAFVCGIIVGAISIGAWILVGFWLAGRL